MADEKYTPVLQEDLRKQVKKKFKGKQTLESRIAPKFPEGVERDYRRVTNAYMRLLNQIIKEDLIPEIRKLAKQELEPGYYRKDDAADLVRKLSKLFDESADKLQQSIANFNLQTKLETVATRLERLTEKEWKRIVHETLGIDLLSDYYSGEFYKKMLKEWVAENVDLIKTIPQESMSRMKRIMLDGYLDGKTTTSIVKELQEEFGMSRDHARMIARDQTAKLNSEITHRQQVDAGVTKYRWSTSRDSRVRDCHKELDGQIFQWDDPPEMWYDTKSRGRVYTGRRCNPGQDFCCRCCALPVFDIDKIKV